MVQPLPVFFDNPKNVNRFSHVIAPPPLPVAKTEPPSPLGARGVEAVDLDNLSAHASDNEPDDFVALLDHLNTRALARLNGAFP